MAASKSDIRAGVVFINMGGPSDLSEVEGFMRRLFNDPHIISAPYFVRKFVSKMITMTRTSRVKEHYLAIGGGSPLKSWTEKQAEKTHRKLRDSYPSLTFKTAYSYSEPFIIDAIAELSESNPDRIITVPLYPQYSMATLGSVYFDLAEANKRLGLGDRLRTLGPFYEHEGYIKCMVEMLRHGLDQAGGKDNLHVVFSAHALPQKLINRGDPYGSQIDRTVYLMLQNVPLKDYTVSFQSKIGPVKWMQPATIDTVERLGLEGIKSLLAVPVGFVCDHIETLYELDIELRQIAEKNGIENFYRAPVFNDDDCFIDFLAGYIETELRQ